MDPIVRGILRDGKVSELRRYLLSLKSESEDELKRALHPKSPKETTMLHEAIAMRDDATTCSLLLSFGSGGANVRDVNGNTPLHLCAKYGRYRCAALLLLFGARKDIKNERGLDPENVAKENKQYHVMSILDQSALSKPTKADVREEGDVGELMEESMRRSRDLDFQERKQALMCSKSTEIALTLVTSTLNALIDRATTLWREHREHKKDVKILKSLIDMIRASVRATTKSLGPLGTLKYFDDWALPRRESIRRVSVLPRDVECDETAKDSSAAWGLGCVKSIRRLAGTKDLYFQSKTLGLDSPIVFWKVKFSRPVHLAAIQISWIRRCIPSKVVLSLEEFGRVGAAAQRKCTISNIESKVWYKEDHIAWKVVPITALTLEMSNLDNSENSENIIAFENVEFFEYVKEKHATELEVHNSLSSVLRRCSIFGFHDNFVTVPGLFGNSVPLQEQQGEEVTEEERNRTELIPKTLEQLRMDSTVPMTQLGISSGSVESMLDVVDTILFNVLVRLKRGGKSRENHVFPEDLFKSLETKIDEIVQEQNCKVQKNLKHQTTDSVSDVQAKFDKDTISATTQSIAIEEQGMLIRSTVGVNSSVLLDIGFKTGKAAWEMELVEDTTSQCTCFGAATKPVTDSSYERSPDMWMYRCYNGQLYTRGTSSGRKCKRIKKGNIIRVELDMDIGTLRYFVDGEDQGVCFTDMNKYGEVFPAVAFYGQDRAVRLLRVECTARITPFRLCQCRPCSLLIHSEDNNNTSTMAMESLHAETVVRSRTLTNSLCSHPVSDGSVRVMYNFESEVQMLKFEELHTRVAIADDPKRDEEEDEEEQQNSGSVASGIVTFEIWGDGTLLWSSPNIRVADRKKINWKDEKYACIVPILHVKVLELRTRCKGSNMFAQCVWVEPILVAETMSSRFHREMFSKIPPLISTKVLDDYSKDDDVMYSLAARLLRQLGHLADARLRLIRDETLFSNTPMIPYTAAFPFVVCLTHEAFAKMECLLRALFDHLSLLPKNSLEMMRCALLVLKVNLRTYVLSLSSDSSAKSTHLDKAMLIGLHQLILRYSKKNYGTLVNTSLSQVEEMLQSVLEPKSARRCRMIRSAASSGVLEVQVKWPVIRNKTEIDARYERLVMLVQLFCQRHNFRYEFLGAYVRLSYVVIEIPENEDIVSVLRHDLSSCFAQAGFDTWTFPDGETNIPVYSESGTDWNRDEELAHSPANGYLRMYDREGASYNDVLSSVRSFVNDRRWLSKS